MPNIRMVWWDNGRVLYDHLADWLLENLAKISNPSIKPHEVYGKIVKSGLVISYDLGKISTDAFAEAMQNLLGFPDRQCFILAWKMTLVPNPFVWRIVSILRKNFYPQGIISNINELHTGHLEKDVSPGAIMQFRPRIYSYQEGVAKPDLEIFRIALDKANREYPWHENLSPEECVFIDDLLENVEAARSLGWHAIHHNSVFVTKTLHQLSELGVRI